MVLPVEEKRSEIEQLIREKQVVVISSETGTGKTTKIPAYVYEMFGQPVICSQPRRIAAVSIAKRVAEEMGTSLGRKVGYSVRFEERTSGETVIRYVTDGTLVRECIEDETLSKYKAVIIDEVHERTINIDLLLGLVKDAIRARSDLRVVIMSATISTDRFEEYFPGATSLHIKSRSHPIELKYLGKPEDYTLESVTRAIDIDKHSPEGDILVFLTGEDEIENAVKEVEKRKRGDGSITLHAFPLYSSLPLYAQNVIFEKTKGRKVVFATNIAETSITIESVVYVIDCGFAKQKIYDSSMKSEMLLKLPISKSSADQRKGRAGRVRAGVCYRLYEQRTYEEMEQFNIPEILRGELSALILKMVRLGIKNLATFDFIEPPLPESVIVALNQLYFLGAIDGYGKITEEGRAMVEFPLEPKQSKAILASVKHGVEGEVTAIIAMSGNIICDRRKIDRLVDEESDHRSYYAMMQGYEESKERRRFAHHNGLNEKNMENALRAKRQLRMILDKVKGSMPDLFAGKSSAGDNAYVGRSVSVEDRVSLAMLEGYFLQTARSTRGHSAILSGSGAKVKIRRLAPPIGGPRRGQGSLTHAMGWLLYGELTKMDGKYVVRMVSNVPGKAIEAIKARKAAELRAIEFSTDMDFR
jgi:pre-mRNA-splicing factor ATP-dependent RNA helicase DHX15/PRP43